MTFALPYSFPQPPPPGTNRRDHRDPALHLRAPAFGTPASRLRCAFIVGEVLLTDREIPWQRAIVWAEEAGAGKDAHRFDAGVGLLLAGDQVVLQVGVGPKPGGREGRIRRRLGLAVKPGHRLELGLDFHTDGTVSASASIGPGPGQTARARRVPHRWTGSRQVAAYRFGFPREMDFKIDGRRNTKRPGAWQPLYAWRLDALEIDNRVFEELPPAPRPEPPPADPPAPAPDPPAPQPSPETPPPAPQDEEGEGFENSILEAMEVLTAAGILLKGRKARIAAFWAEVGNAVLVLVRLFKGRRP